MVVLINQAVVCQNPGHTQNQDKGEGFQIQRCLECQLASMHLKVSSGSSIGEGGTLPLLRQLICTGIPYGTLPHQLHEFITLINTQLFS